MLDKMSWLVRLAIMAGGLFTLGHIQTAYPSETHRNFAKYSFTPISNELSTGAISYNDIVESHDGLLWIATNSNLLKFDGYHFEEVHTGIEGAIYSLGLDANENLWLGSYSDATVYDYHNRHFKHYSFHPGDQSGIPDDSVLSYCLDRQGHLWLGMLANLAEFHEESQSFTTYAPWSNGADNLPASKDIVIKDILQQENGEFWLATEQNGLIRFNSQQQQAKVFLTTEHEPIQLRKVGALIDLDSQNLLLATDDGLIKFNTLDHTLQRFPEKSPIKEKVSEIVRAPNRDIWVAGKNVYQISNGSDVATYYADADFSIGESDAQVGKLYVDNENTVFVLYDYHGIYRASPFSSKVRMVNAFQGTNNQIKVLAKSSKEQLWIGFAKGLVSAKPFVNGLDYQIIRQKNGNDFKQVSAIHEGLNGQMWIASDLGITAINPTGEQRHYALPHTNSPMTEVRSLVQDFQGNVWARFQHRHNWSNSNWPTGLIFGFHCHLTKNCCSTSRVRMATVLSIPKRDQFRPFTKPASFNSPMNSLIR